MKIRRAVLGSVMGAVIACGPRSDGPAPRTETPEPEASTLTGGPGADLQVGDALDVPIPLFDGGTLDLERLRGRVVVLEISGTWHEAWSADQQFYRSLADHYGGKLAVVTVALDPDRSGLQAHWERDPLPFILGWDPQGALAARLRISTLPTVVVMDTQGVVAALWSGFRLQQRARLRSEVESLVTRR